MDKLYESRTNAVGTINATRFNQPQEKLLKQDEFRAKVGVHTGSSRNRVQKPWPITPRSSASSIQPTSCTRTARGIEGVRSGGIAFSTLS